MVHAYPAYICRSMVLVSYSERCEQEARAIVALNHLHICTLHDVGPDYLVIE